MLHRPANRRDASIRLHPTICQSATQMESAGVCGPKRVSYRPEQMERWPSGLRRPPAKRVYVRKCVAWVQIPFSPPELQIELRILEGPIEAATTEGLASSSRGTRVDPMKTLRARVAKAKKANANKSIIIRTAKPSVAETARRLGVSASKRSAIVERVRKQVFVGSKRISSEPARRVSAKLSKR